MCVEEAIVEQKADGQEGAKARTGAHPAQKQGLDNMYFSAETEIIEISVYLKLVHLIKTAVDSPVLSPVEASRGAEYSG